MKNLHLKVMKQLMKIYLKLKQILKILSWKVKYDE